jgi:hypothetical protein
MTKRSSIIVYDVCHPTTGILISSFRLCNKHGIEFMKKWKSCGYLVNDHGADAGTQCDICPDKEKT